MDYKYRVDFYYWNCGSGFTHVETYTYRNTYVEAKEYVNNINKNVLKKYMCDGIWIKIVDNENDYVISDFWWKNTKDKNTDNIHDHDENWYAKRYLTGDNVWVYEREAGDGGLVVAESYEKALDELRKVYDDIDERIDPDCEKYTWGLSILSVGDYSSKENVFITHPY